MGEVITNTEGASPVAYLSSAKAAVTIKKSNGKSSGAKPTTTQAEHNINKIVLWGEDNLFPQNVIKDVRSNTAIASVLDDKARMAYAGGIVYGMASYDEKGNEIFRPRRIPEIEQWFRKWDCMRYLMESSKDLYYFYNVFPELILSRDRSIITGMCVQEAPECRWEKQGTDGLNHHVYINGMWGNGGTADNSVIVPALDTYWDPITSLREGSRYKYIFPISYASPGCKFYQLADWDVIRSSGWLDVANAIPKFKKALMKNQMTIKYHLQIPETYFDWKYKGFSTRTDAEKDTIFKNELDTFNAFLTNAENAGKTIMTLIKSDSAGKAYPGWEVKEIDDKIKDGIYIEDSKEAYQHILFALGYHSALSGAGPGDKNRAGSGSDIRVALNKHVSTIQPHQHLLLKPIHFAFDYNGWLDKYSTEKEWLEIRFKNSLVTKLDEGKETQQQAA